MSRCQQGLRILIQVTPYVSDGFEFSKRTGGYGSGLSSPKTGLDYSTSYP